MWHGSALLRCSRAHPPNTDAHSPNVNAHLPSMNAHRPSVNAHFPSINAHLPSTNAHSRMTCGHRRPVNARFFAIIGLWPGVFTQFVRDFRRFQAVCFALCSPCSLCCMFSPTCFKRVRSGGDVSSVSSMPR